jgi:hypothetical protein
MDTNSAVTVTLSDCELRGNYRFADFRAGNARLTGGN